MSVLFGRTVLRFVILEMLELLESAETVLGDTSAEGEVEVSSMLAFPHTSEWGGGDTVGGVEGLESQVVWSNCLSLCGKRTSRRKTVLHILATIFREVLRRQSECSCCCPYQSSTCCSQGLPQHVHVIPEVFKLVTNFKVVQDGRVSF